MEGRDIGTVVFPDADIKVFMTASLDERARRRKKEYIEKNIDISLDEVKKNLMNRDEIDSGRKVSPLTIAEGAVEVNTSEVSIDERAKRRKKEYSEKGIDISLEEVKKNLLSRDKIDSGRDVSPLTIADGAVEVNTSEVSIEEQVNIILEEVKKAADKKGILLRVN